MGQEEVTSDQSLYLAVSGGEVNGSPSMAASEAAEVPDEATDPVPELSTRRLYKVAINTVADSPRPACTILDSNSPQKRSSSCHRSSNVWYGAKQMEQS